MIKSSKGPKLIDLGKSELVFKVNDTNITKSSIMISNITHNRIFYKVVKFTKIKASNSKDFTVKPSKGEMPGGSSISIEFSLNSEQIDRKNLENCNFNGKFLVIAAEVPNNLQVFLK